MQLESSLRRASTTPTTELGRPCPPRACGRPHGRRLRARRRARGDLRRGCRSQYPERRSRAPLCLRLPTSRAVHLRAGSVPKLIRAGPGRVPRVPDPASVAPLRTRATPTQQVPPPGFPLGRQAFSELGAEQTAPVAVKMPVDTLMLGRGAVPAADREQQRPTGDPEAIDRAARVLQTAESPVIVAGGGVLRSGASEELVAMAELCWPRSSCPPAAKAHLRRHPLAHRAVATADLVADADVLLAVGPASRRSTSRSPRLPRSLASHDPPRYRRDGAAALRAGRDRHLGRRQSRPRPLATPEFTSVAADLVRRGGVEALRRTAAERTAAERRPAAADFALGPVQN